MKGKRAMRKFFIAAALAVSITTAMAPAFAANAPTAAYSTAESDIGTLIDNPVTCAIVEKYIPGFSKRDQIDLSRPFTLRGIQQYAPDLITDDVLTKIDADLAKLPAK